MTPDAPCPDAAPATPAPASPLPAAARPEDSAAPAPAVAANQLTPEEQMALFEKDLKENDWGHQPC